ncbi:MAG: methionyl-tRNA formyltransferase [Alicyclobacillus sp.]|nr:methionyl-tRNA formyltransferase [Alicyclobacillus sp.]
MSQRPRVLFLGTSDFAVPVLQALAAGDYELVGVVTQPDRPAGRRRELAPSPVKVAAVALGLPLWQPPRVRAPEVLAALAELRPDVAVTAAYGQILPQALLDLPRHGCLNLHPSLLPRWRGAAPVQRALLAGDAQTGVCVMRMALALDAGPVLAVHQTAIDPEEDAGTLSARLAAAGAQLLLQVLPDYLAGRLPAVPQAEQGVTYAERLTRADEWLDWTQPAWQVHNHVRALAPQPGACTRVAEVRGDGLVKVWRTRWQPLDGPEAPPGRVERLAGGTVGVRCADAWLPLVEVQPAGKRRLPASDWLRGAGGAVQFAAPAQPASGEGPA